MRVLSLNLHGYQEKEPVKKLQIIADSILENDIDIICFSECAQRYFTPIVDRNIKKDNAAYLIQQALNTQGNSQYELHYEKVHFGYFGFVEGLAVLSRYPILSCESFYVSAQHSMLTPNTRKVMEVLINVGNHPIMIYNAHLGFDRKNQFLTQFEKIHERASRHHIPSIITGDFNIDSASIDYMEMMHYGYVDSYSFNKAEGDTWHKGRKSLRLDYMLARSPLNIQQYCHLFKEERVSDHLGILTQFSF